MPRNLSESVAVITGASSGIGRATALAFAERGAAVVLAARREEPLREAAEQCERIGGRALAVPTNVTDQAQVEALAHRAVEQFGRIDIWVNNAGVTLFGRFEESPADAYRQVFETNLYGMVYGARAVLPHFREQGSGVLVNVASAVAVTGQPYTSADVASKAAILGFTESLRMELALDEAKQIHACAVLPAAVDTPLYQHAANYTGRTPRAMNPVSPASEVARAIVRLVERPKRELYVGHTTKAAVASRLLMPWKAERLQAALVEREHFTREPAEPTPGNLFEPLAEWASTSGDWGVPGGRPGRSRMVFALPLAAVGAGAGAFAWRRLRHGNTRGPANGASPRRPAMASAERLAQRGAQRVPRASKGAINRDGPGAFARGALRIPALLAASARPFLRRAR